MPCLESLAESSGPAESPGPPPAPQNRDLASATVGDPSQPDTPEVPRPEDSRGQEVEWGGQDGGRGDRKGGVGGCPDLPRGVPARGRPGVSDHAAGSSGTGNGGAQAPGRAERGVPGARMSLALALGKGRAAAAAALWGARSLLLPVSERAGLSGRGWPWWSRVFLSKAIRQRLAAQSPLGHTEDPAAAPPGPGLGAGGAGAEAPRGRPASGCRLRGLGLGRGRSAGLRRGKLKRKVFHSAWGRGEGRQPPLVPVPTAGRQVGRPRAGGELAPHGATALPKGAWKSFKGSLRPEPGRLLHIPDRSARASSWMLPVTRSSLLNKAGCSSTKPGI